MIESFMLIILINISYSLLICYYTYFDSFNLSDPSIGHCHITQNPSICLVVSGEVGIIWYHSFGSGKTFGTFKIIFKELLRLLVPKSIKYREQ